MSTVIEMHESILGEFAHKEDAEALGLALIDKGWPVMYSDNGAPEWRFESLADYRRFGLDYEAAVDGLSRAGALRVTWGCDCDERQHEPCPHGEDPTKALQEEQEQPLEELYGWPLRRAMERRYPGLREWIEANIDCIYGALSFAVMLEEETGTTSASGLWLRRKWPQRHGGGLKNYDKHVQDFAEFVHAASEDAWFSEWLAKERSSLEELQPCETCGGLKRLDCCCEVKNGPDD